MKKLHFILAAASVIAMTPACFAWDNPNRAAAPQSSVAADKASQIRLENRRVQNINGDTFTYNTGRKVITIKADSPASRQFLRDVQSGRTSAGASVRLTPDRNSPFNTEYKAR